MSMTTTRSITTTRTQTASPGATVTSTNTASWCMHIPTFPISTTGTITSGLSHHEGRVGFAGAGDGPGDVRSEATVEHGALARGLDVAEGAQQRAGSVGSGTATESMCGGAHLDGDVGAVLRSEKRPRLQGAVDRVAVFGPRPA